MLGARNAGLLPLQKIWERGTEGLEKMNQSVKNYGKVSPIGLVSGKAFAVEDAKAATQLGGALVLDAGKVCSCLVLYTSVSLFLRKYIS